MTFHALDLSAESKKRNNSSIKKKDEEKKSEIESINVNKKQSIYRKTITCLFRSKPGLERFIAYMQLLNVRDVSITQERIYQTHELNILNAKYSLQNKNIREKFLKYREERNNKKMDYILAEFSSLLGVKTSSVPQQQQQQYKLTESRSRG